MGRRRRGRRRREIGPGRPTSAAEAISYLVERVPALRPLLDAHLADHSERLALGDVEVVRRVGPWLGPETFRDLEENFPHVLGRDPQPARPGRSARQG